MTTAAWQMGRSFETDTAKELEEAYNAEDIPISRIESEFNQAKHLISQAIGHLVRAADIADPYGRAKPIDDLVELLDDNVDERMNKAIRKLKEGA